MNNKILGGIALGAAVVGGVVGQAAKPADPVPAGERVSVECIDGADKEIHADVDAALYDSENKVLKMSRMGQDDVLLKGRRCYVRNAKGETIERTN